MNATRGLPLVAALVVGVGFVSGHPGEVGAAIAVAFAAVVAAVTTRDLALRARTPTRPVQRVGDTGQIEQLRRVGDSLAAAQASEVGVDRELRPLLRPIAAMRLARRGVDLDRHRETARELLGEPLWELVRADRAAAANRVAGGISPAELDGVIERLERT